MYDPKLHFQFRQLLSEKENVKARQEYEAFSQRAFANLSRIKNLFTRLYGNQKNWETQYWLLMEDLIQTFIDRPVELRRQDMNREADRDWYLNEKLVGMMLYVDRFAGKLDDFESKVSYIKELGVNWIHLMPLLKSPEGSNDGGYAVSDYRAVDPKFGSMEELRRIADKLRGEDMLLTLDMVMNHTADEHEWAQKARSGDPYYQDFYYFFDNRSMPDWYEEGMPEVFPQSAPGNFTHIPELNKWVMTVFHNYQWDLNYRNPIVFREMMKILLFLANVGVDIIRLDAVAFTWKIPGSTSQNTEEAHVILQLMKACAEVVAPGFAFIAEAIVAPHEVIRYFGEGESYGHECEIAYNATFMALLWDAVASEDTTMLRKGAQAIPAKPDGTTWINYLRCHDDIGLGFDENILHELGKSPYHHKKYLVDYYSGNFKGSMALGAPFAFNPKTGDARISGSLAALAGLERAIKDNNSELIDLAIQKILMLHGIILSYGGLPMIYYGDEIGMGNDHSYLDDPDKSYDNRWMHRPIMDWNKADKRVDPASPEGRIYKGLQKLILLRKSSPEFADQNSLSIEDSGNPFVFSFLRWNYEGAKTLVLSNFTSSTHFVRTEHLSKLGFIPYDMRDKLSGSAPKFYHDLIEIPPYGQYWLTDKTTFDAFQAAEEMEALQSQFKWGV
ncbi:MAG: alpha-amylase family protein [Bacteroidia bacterium]|nr:alpha-amylase family protein [Bacteroidia bacterium]